jgi:hypothetical protein
MDGMLEYGSQIDMEITGERESKHFCSRPTKESGKVWLLLRGTLALCLFRATRSNCTRTRTGGRAVCCWTYPEP